MIERSSLTATPRSQERLRIASAGKQFTAAPIERSGCGSPGDKRGELALKISTFEEATDSVQFAFDGRNAGGRFAGERA